VSVRWESTSFGPGNVVRFKSVKSHKWTYAIYRGTSTLGGRTLGYEFSDYPLGPITRWLGYWPEFIETAVTS
jgi:hypothetical protein